MTFQSKYRENKRLIERYVNYLEECTSFGQKLKLSGEIGRLSRQNEQINKMEYSETREEMHDYSIIENSSLNESRAKIK